MIKDDNLPRNQWTLARVTETHMNADAQVRSVRVCIVDSMLTVKGKRTPAPSYLECPIQKLVLLVKNERNQEIPIKKVQ